MRYTVVIHPSGFVTGSLLGSYRRPNLEKCARAPRGSKGLTSKGKLTILDGCALLSSLYPNRLSFLTWTFPPECCDQVKLNWSRLVRLLLKKLQYWLKKVGLPDHYLGVAELQENGNPHLHLIFVGRRSSYQRWLISPALLDKLLFEAVQEICPNCDRSHFGAAGRVEPVRCAATLGKYLCKPKLKSSANWFPPNWWFCSQRLRRAVARSRIKFRIRISNWTALQKLFAEAAGGWFKLIIRDEIAVGWIGFIPNCPDNCPEKIPKTLETGSGSAIVQVS